MYSSYLWLFLLFRAWVVFSGAMCFRTIGGLTGALLGLVSSVLYVMVVWSYTSACFTDPGSPSVLSKTSDGSYSTLPQHRVQDASFSSVTVKEDGSERFCQKCMYKKPDRAHHCRSCKRCILSKALLCPRGI